LEADGLREAQRDGAGEESCADLLSGSGAASTLSHCLAIVRADAPGLALPASPHVAPGAPVAEVSSSASWLSSPLILLFPSLRKY